MSLILSFSQAKRVCCPFCYFQNSNDSSPFGRCMPIIQWFLQSKRIDSKTLETLCPVCGGVPCFFIMPVTNSEEVLKWLVDSSFCILRCHSFTNDTERNHKKNGHHHNLVLYLILYIAVIASSMSTPPMKVSYLAEQMGCGKVIIFFSVRL